MNNEKDVAYRIYHTEGIVVQIKAVAEADALLFIYTKTMGLILVSAKSLRLAKSKLRFVLQRFSEARIDIVRGKHGWKLTSAQALHTHSVLHRHPYRRIALAAYTALLLRLVQGEEAHEEVYVLLQDMMHLLSLQDDRTGCLHCEILFAVRLLSLLGYWSGEERVLSVPLQEALREVENNKKDFVKKINAALQETQL